MIIYMVKRVIEGELSWSGSVWKRGIIGDIDIGLLWRKKTLVFGQQAHQYGDKIHRQFLDMIVEPNF